MHIRVSLCIKFNFEQTILNFSNKFARERYLLSKIEKLNIIIEFRLLKLLLVPIFSLNSQFWFFGLDLPKKGFCGVKQKKWRPHIFYIILHIQINLVQNFSSNWQFWFFGQDLLKKIFPIKNRKSEHRHGILHIWISLGTKFQLKLIILSFQTKFTQKRYFQLKTEQAVQWLQAFDFCVVNANSSVVFKYFEDLKDLIILNISQVKMISKVVIKFRSKFQFQFPL